LRINRTKPLRQRTPRRWRCLGDRFGAPAQRGRGGQQAPPPFAAPVRQGHQGKPLQAPLSFALEQIGLAHQRLRPAPLLRGPWRSNSPGCGGSPAGRFCSSCSRPRRWSPSRTSIAPVSSNSRTSLPICSGSPRLRLAARSLPQPEHAAGGLPGGKGQLRAAAALGHHRRHAPSRERTAGLHQPVEALQSREERKFWAQGDHPSPVEWRTAWLGAQISAAESRRSACFGSHHHRGDAVGQLKAWRQDAPLNSGSVSWNSSISPTW